MSLLAIHKVVIATAHSLQKATYWVYVLACDRGRFYVGFAGNLHARLAKHFRGEGAQFTRMFKPLRVLEIRRASSEQDEFRHWESFCQVYGSYRVGGYSQNIAAACGFKLRQYKRWADREYRNCGLFRASINDRKAISL